jgi:hypothetical protein
VALISYALQLRKPREDLGFQYVKNHVVLNIAFTCRLGGVVVSVLATGPKGCGFEPGQGDGFLRAIKIRSTPSSWMGSKAGRSLVVRFYGM